MKTTDSFIILWEHVLGEAHLMPSGLIYSGLRGNTTKLKKYRPFRISDQEFSDLHMSPNV